MWSLSDLVNLNNPHLAALESFVEELVKFMFLLWRQAMERRGVAVPESVKDFWDVRDYGDMEQHGLDSDDCISRAPMSAPWMSPVLPGFLRAKLLEAMKYVIMETPGVVTDDLACKPLHPLIRVLCTPEAIRTFPLFVYFHYTYLLHRSGSLTIAFDDFLDDRDFLFVEKDPRCELKDNVDAYLLGKQHFYDIGRGLPGDGILYYHHWLFDSERKEPGGDVWTFDWCINDPKAPKQGKLITALHYVTWRHPDLLDKIQRECRQISEDCADDRHDNKLVAGVSRAPTPPGLEHFEFAICQELRLGISELPERELVRRRWCTWCFAQPREHSFLSYLAETVQQILLTAPPRFPDGALVVKQEPAEAGAGPDSSKKRRV